MKKAFAIITIISALIMSSCGQPIFARIGGTLEQNIDYHPETFDDAWYWVANNIRYKRDPFLGLKRLPEETYALKYGDCEDFSLLLAYFGNQLGEDVRVVAGYDSKGNAHCVCRYNGVLIEPQEYNGIIPESAFDIWKEYSYEEALYTTEIRTVE